MAPPLDTLVAGAVADARLLERSLHDHGPWSVRWADTTVPAERQVGATSVAFSASFPADHQGDGEYAELWCRDELVQVRYVGPPPATEHGVDLGWVVGLSEPVAA